MQRSPTNYAAAGQSFNQTQVGQYLDSVSQTASSDLGFVLDELISSRRATASAFDQIGGAAYASATRMNIQNASLIAHLGMRSD